MLHPAADDIVLRAGIVPPGTVSHTELALARLSSATSARLTLSIHWYVETAHLDLARPAAVVGAS